MKEAQGHAIEQQHSMGTAIVEQHDYLRIPATLDHICYSLKDNVERFFPPDPFELTRTASAMHASLESGVSRDPGQNSNDDRGGPCCR